MHPRRHWSGLNGSLPAYLVSRLCSGIDLGMYARGTHLCSQSLPIDGVLVVTPNAQAGEKLVSDIEFFLSSKNAAWDLSDHADRDERFSVLSFFPWEVLPFDVLSPTSTISAERLHTLYQLIANTRSVVVTTVPALMQCIVRPEQFCCSVHKLSLGEHFKKEKLLEILDSGGYVRSTLVEECGQMAVRGAIVDFYPPGWLEPIRVELFGDKIESLRTFNQSTQRSLLELKEIAVIPASEVFVQGFGADGVSRKTLPRLRARASELDIPQKSIIELEQALINGSPWPGKEHLQPLLTEESAFLWDYLPSNLEVLVCDESGVIAAADDFETLIMERADKALNEGRLFPEPQKAYDEADSFLEKLEGHCTHYFDSLEFVSTDVLVEEEQGPVSEGSALRAEVYSNTVLYSSIQADRHKEQPLKPVIDEVLARIDEGYRVGITVAHHSRVSRILDLLAGYELEAIPFEGSFDQWLSEVLAAKRAGRKWPVTVLSGILSSGLRVPADGFLLIADNEIFPEIISRPSQRAATSVRRFIGSISQLKEGDYVVHIDHGVAVYQGLAQLEIEGKTGDYLQLEYAEEAKLFIPVENIGKVQKYSASEGKRPALSRLGGKSWDRTKKKVRENVAEIAGKLINLLAKREIAPGFSFGDLGSDDLEFADGFIFEETPDQHKAIEEVLRDMSRKRPMDRLVCGDVGYGKTEVAMRAAFKAVSCGKQVAVLVPTTVLADQHLATFSERFSDYPLTIGCVSRFFSSAENKRTLQALERGEIDIIIGTHRLIQKDVFFRDLGLVIIDEEHRFGVTHKEKLKRFRAEVDVLTLTATPIPRTLHMSLTGIRELSVIETPPINRQVIRTYIAPYDSGIVREAILRELGRSGQVFYIYNRVANISVIADEIAELVPEARVAFAHGQMKEHELAKVMHSFVSREVNVLVSTTIVESGLDIANANTMIVRQADKFGLAQLYQLRGRIGRGARRAYAYLLISDPRTLGPEAKKRLEVLQSLDDLGVGFRLALHDMEIRGAGNLLGKDQSGHIDMVGFELYTRILSDAVRELRARGSDTSLYKTEEVPEVDPEINIGFPAHIPPDYIPDVAERLILYQRLVELRDETEGREMAEEIEDRFGHMPRDVEILLELMVFRSLLRRAGVVSASYRAGTLGIGFHPKARIDVERVLKAVTTRPDKLRLSSAMGLSVVLDEPKVESPGELYDFVKRLFGELGIGVE